MTSSILSCAGDFDSACAYEKIVMDETNTNDKTIHIIFFITMSFLHKMHEIMCGLSFPAGLHRKSAAAREERYDFPYLRTGFIGNFGCRFADTVFGDGHAVFGLIVRAAFPCETCFERQGSAA